MATMDLSGENRDYIETLYEQYEADPSSVEAEWATFFKGFDYGYLLAEEDEVDGAGGKAPAAAGPAAPAPKATEEPAEDGSERRTRRERTDKGVFALVEAYRQHGHRIANLDPLGNNPTSHPFLELSEFSLGDADLEKGVGFGGFRYKTDGSLVALIDVLRKTFCGTLGMEYMGIAEREERVWFGERIEPVLNHPDITAEQKHRILWEVIESEEFEQFLHTRYLGQKRFSVEGCESLLPLLDALVETGSALGSEEMVMGMAHRGRLNVLAHILHKPYELILAEFEGAARSEGAEDEGDVKYHQGYSYDFVTKQGNKMHLSLCPNPSHLELVNPIIEGMVLAKQDYLHDTERDRVVPLQIHGEAAFCGQGIVTETLNLAQLEGYQNGGTIHVIVNNQLGYTATPEETRFTTYATDGARALQAPVIHVNADDPEAVVYAAQLAMQYREHFKKDVLIDLVGYRRHGHNEADDPTVTSPLMYGQIGKHPTVATLYAERLIAEGAIAEEEVEDMRTEVRATLDRSQEKAKRLKVKPRTQSFGGSWQGLAMAGDDWEADTGVPESKLKRIAQRATGIPEGFNVHRTVERIMASRREMVDGKKPVDWGCGEMLAYGTLLTEKVPVRLVGQDVQRGTFAHRHAVWHDTKTGEKYDPLSNLSRDQAAFEVVNTMLSELAVLGFEYGISSADPRRLIMWEAQFGDFANGAQLIIDQYISGGEAKWHRMSGIVMLLPHGYEGMGPEHSSARLERFLQLCAKKNMQVIYPTTPAQIFHALRRQIHRVFRKPLIVMTPKSLLRHRSCVSHISEFARGGFLNVIDDANATEPERVRRVVMCTGKVYYDLAAGREEKGLDEVAIVRVEQLYPFPEEELRTVFDRYPNAEEYLWAQEESMNMGAWYFLQPLMDEVLPAAKQVRYAGRDEAASPAVGDAKQHHAEQQEIVEQAMDLSAKELILEDVKRSRKAGTGDGGS